jgi:O-antigen/teichoic acid export membrane protein
MGAESVRAGWDATRRRFDEVRARGGAHLAVPHGGRLVRAVGWNASGTVIARLLTLASSIVVGRALGVAGFGAIGVMQQTVTLLVTVTTMGLPTTLTTDVAAARTDASARVGRLIAAALTASGAFSLLVAVGLALGGRDMAERVMGVPALAGALPGAALLLVAQAVFGMQVGALGGLERFRSCATATVLSGAAALGGAAIGAQRAGVAGAIWGLGLGALATAILTHALLAQACHAMRTPLSLHEFRASMQQLWATARAATLNNLLVVGSTWFVSITVAHQPDGAIGAGLLALGLQWRAAVLAMPLTASSPVLSVLSTLRHDGAARRSIGLVACLVAAGLALAGALAVMVASPRIVQAYGSGFDRAIPVLGLFAASAIPLAVAGMLGQLAFGRGDRRSGVIACAVWSATLVVLCLLLTPRYGAAGAALATLLAAPVQVLILWKRSPEYRA